MQPLPTHAAVIHTHVNHPVVEDLPEQEVSEQQQIQMNLSESMQRVAIDALDRAQTMSTAELRTQFAAMSVQNVTFATMNAQLMEANRELRELNARLLTTITDQQVQIATLQAQIQQQQTEFTNVIADLNGRIATLEKKQKSAELVSKIAIGVSVACLLVGAGGVAVAVFGPGPIIAAGVSGARAIVSGVKSIKTAIVVSEVGRALL